MSKIDKGDHIHETNPDQTVDLDSRRHVLGLLTIFPRFYPAVWPLSSWSSHFCSFLQTPGGRHFAQDTVELRTDAISQHRGLLLWGWSPD